MALKELFGGGQNYGNMDVAFQGYGSSFTGNARRRGEIDMAVGYARLNNGLYVRSRGEEVVEQELFVKFLERMIETTAARFGVETDVHYISLVDARDGTSDMADDGLFVDHIAKASPSHRLGDVLQNLKQRAIDITQPLEEWQKAEILRIGLGYMAVKAEFFAGGLQWLERPDNNELCFEVWGENAKPNKLALEPELLRLEILRRALEFAKAAARKVMAVGVVDGLPLNHTDVTSRPDMYRQFESIAGLIDGSGDINRDHQLLVRLDSQYDEILEEALKRKRTYDYERWLKGSIIKAVETAYQLAARCHGYIEEVVEDRGLALASFPGYYDDEYRLVAVDEAGLNGPVRSGSK